LINQDGNVPDIVMPTRRHKAVAKKLMKKLLLKQGFALWSWVRHKLRSYETAKKELPNVEHTQHKRLNHYYCAENYSTQLTRLRHKRMWRFKTAGLPQNFLTTWELIYQQTQPQ
jgi:putative transposase